MTDITGEIMRNRALAVGALLTTKERQGRGSCYSEETGCYCALGVMARELGFDAKTDECDSADAYDFLADKLGWSHDAEQAVWMLNDDRHFRFATIGKRLAKEWGISVSLV